MEDQAGKQIWISLEEEQKTAFVDTFTEAASVQAEWKDLNADLDSARTLNRYLQEKAVPYARLRYSAWNDLLSSWYEPNQKTVFLYKYNFPKDGFSGYVVLQTVDGQRYLSYNRQLWEALHEIAAESAVMRDAAFPDASNEANWMYHDILYQTDFAWDGSADRLRDWEMNLKSEDRTELSRSEILYYLSGNRLDYWADLNPGAGGHCIMGHPADEPDGEGKTIVIALDVGSGYICEDKELAYLLANTVKLEFLLESSKDWRVCDGSTDYEKALSVFAAKYFDQYSQSEQDYLQAACEGTFRESDVPKITGCEVEMISEKQNAVLFRWIKETTYYNDIMHQVDIWAGGSHEMRENSDGSRTVRNEYLTYLLNDGEGWYYVREISGGYNTEFCVNEDGSLKTGLIRY